MNFPNVELRTFPIDRFLSIHPPEVPKSSPIFLKCHFGAERQLEPTSSACFVITLLAVGTYCSTSHLMWMVSIGWPKLARDASTKPCPMILQTVIFDAFARTPNDSLRRRKSFSGGRAWQKRCFRIWTFQMWKLERFPLEDFRDTSTWSAKIEPHFLKVPFRRREATWAN